jgi:hypothetical protein
VYGYSINCLTFFFKVFVAMFGVCVILFADRRHPADDEKKTTTTTTMARPLKTKESLGAMNSVRFPIRLDLFLCTDSVARGVSKSDIIREALEAYYAPVVQVKQVSKPAKAKAKAKAKA